MKLGSPLKTILEAEIAILEEGNSLARSTLILSVPEVNAKGYGLHAYICQFVAKNFHKKSPCITKPEMFLENVALRKSECKVSIQAGHVVLHPVRKWETVCQRCRWPYEGQGMV